MSRAEDNYCSCGKEMIVYGMMALNSFPFWENSVVALCALCEKVYFRFDAMNGDPEILRKIRSVAGDKFGGAFIATGKWTVPQWREDCLRLIDSAKQKPDIVLCPDEDEIFDYGLSDELVKFHASDKSAMMFTYHPPFSLEGYVLNDGVPYPSEPHMKAFKWQERLCYYPYHGNAKISNYVLPSCWWYAKTKIQHHCACTEGLARIKQWRDNTKFKSRRACKAVTIMGFGPSALGQIEMVGEMWTLNNGYEIFDKDIMRYCTRVFEMHSFGPRTGKIWDSTRNYLRRVGKLGQNDELNDRNELRDKHGFRHVECLDTLGKRGHLIVMQKPHPEIANSVAFPLSDAERLMGAPIWGGSGSYMLALAALEEYTEVRLYGFDQMDWEHIVQRESMAVWLGFLRGRGVVVSGKTTILERNKHRYGYEYGPEWNEEVNKTMWYGFPFELTMKTESHAIKGDLFDVKKR